MSKYPRSWVVQSQLYMLNYLQEERAMPKRKHEVPDPDEEREIRETERRLNKANKDVPKDAPDRAKWTKRGE